MVIFTVIPQSIENEITRSAYVLKEFTADSSRGPDTLIPDAIFAKARGVAIITYAKMGVFLSARCGSGVVVAKLPKGGWSAPSAVGIVGIGGGFEFGIEMTAIIMMLMTSNAVRAFMKEKNVTLGAGVSVAAGPLGRDLEGDVAVKCPAAMYSYAKAKGLFVGINLSGTLVLERKKANEKCYGPGIRAYDILSGNVKIPAQCQVLHQVLIERCAVARKKAVKQAVDLGSKAVEKKYGVKGLNKTANKSTDKALRQGMDPATAPRSKTKFLSKSKSSKSKPSYKTSRAPPSRPTHAKKGPAPRPATVKQAPARPTTKQHTTNQAHAGQAHAGQAPPQKQWAEALYSFSGELSCDISFQKSDRIEVISRTQCEFDWWEGRFNGKVGIFPANYTRLIH